MTQSNDSFPEIPPGALFRRKNIALHPRLEATVSRADKTVVCQLHLQSCWTTGECTPTAVFQIKCDLSISCDAKALCESPSWVESVMGLEASAASATGGTCNLGIYAGYMYIPSTSLFASTTGRSLFLPIPIPACENGSSSSSDQRIPVRDTVNVSLVGDSCVRMFTSSDVGMNDRGRGKSTSDADEFAPPVVSW